MKKKIFIVEDEEMLSKVLAEQFSVAGFDVEIASDGEKALELLEKSKPDIILLDIILPKINGFDVLKSIKENPDTQDIPVIMTSNLGRDEDIKQAIKLGAIDYYIKAQHPIFEIIEKVSTFLSLPKSPLERPKVSVKEKKGTAPAPLEVVEEKPTEVEKTLEKPIEKAAEKLRIIEKIIEEKPAEIIIERLIEKPAEKIVEEAKKTIKEVVEKVIEKEPVNIISEKPIEKSKLPTKEPEAIKKPTEKVIEKPKKEAVKKPSKEIGSILGKIIDIAEESAKQVIKKQAEKAAEKSKIIEKLKLKKIEKKIIIAEKPIEKKIKKEDRIPIQLSRGARKFIRMEKAKLNKLNISPEEREKEVAKIYQTFSK